MKERTPSAPAALWAMDLGVTDADIARLRQMLDELKKKCRGRAHGVRADFDRDRNRDFIAHVHLWLVDPAQEEPLTSRFSSEQLDAYLRCLTAMVEGPFIPDWEFSTVQGVSSDELRDIAERWPDVPMNSTLFAAVSNTLNNFLGYPHGEEAELRERTRLEPKSIAELLASWRGSMPDSYFDALM